MHQAGHGFCAVLKHSADCKDVTDGDLFRKRAKEENGLEHERIDI